MGFFLKSKEKNNLALVLDIRSSSIGGALFLISKSGPPEIIYSTREPITLIDDISFSKFLSLSIRTLDTVINRISSQALGSPKRIYCTLSSPWYSSQSRVISFKRETPFLFNIKLANNLIKKEIDLFREEYIDKYKHLDNNIKLLEFKNMNISLNGYSTQKPLNQKATELEMNLFVSMGEEKVLEKIKGSIAKRFYPEDIIFSSFQMNSFAVARDVFVHDENFLLIDIGGEITDISMIKKDILRSSLSFPLGRNYLIREVKKTLDCSIDEAQSFISLYQEDHASKSLKTKLEPVIADIRMKWLKSFQESLASISNDISIPSIVFITADSDLADFFIQIIKIEQFNQYSLTDSKFRIVYLDKQTLHGIIKFRYGILSDPFLIIESIYANRFLKNKIIN